MGWRSVRASLAALAVLVGAGSAEAAILVDQTAPGSTSHTAGGPAWAGFTAQLAGEPGGYFLGSVANAADVAAADAILVALRTGGSSLSAAEQANLNGFLASGKRVIIFGENSSFAGWNASLLGFAGGSAAGDINGTVTPVGTHDLTAGVTSIVVPLGGGATGGTALFSRNVATVWRPAGNLVTILDVNVLQDATGNTQFTANVSDWLGASAATVVPEPATWAMMIMGFGAAGSAVRRRRGRIYRLLETGADGRSIAEDFPCPDDESAVARARSVIAGTRAQLWRGKQLVAELTA